MCKSDVEDEYHFMLKCPAYNNLRKDIWSRIIFKDPLSTNWLNSLAQETLKNYVMLVNLLNLLSRKEKLCKPYGLNNYIHYYTIHSCVYDWPWCV